MIIIPKQNFGAMKFKLNFKGKLRNITKTWVLTKAKALLEIYPT